jgi:hypothetical protein
MKFNRTTFPLIALALGTSGLLMAQGYQPLLNPAPAAYGAAYGQDAWDMPPREFREVQRQGFHDGVEGAKKDFDNHRMPDVNNRDEYRHPKVPKSDREDYREGFRRGYDAAMAHLTGQPGPR